MAVFDHSPIAVERGVFYVQASGHSTKTAERKEKNGSILTRRDEMACQTKARTLHPNLLTSRLISALLRIQLHHVLHRNAAVVPAHHVLHLGHSGGDGLAVLFPHVHPLVHHQLLVVHPQHFIHVLHSLRITPLLHTNQLCILRQLLSVRRLDRLRFGQLEGLRVKQSSKTNRHCVQNRHVLLHFLHLFLHVRSRQRANHFANSRNMGLPAVRSRLFRKPLRHQTLRERTTMNTSLYSFMLKVS